jgi:hypothetical protein
MFRRNVLPEAGVRTLLRNVDNNRAPRRYVVLNSDLIYALAVIPFCHAYDTIFISSMTDYMDASGLFRYIAVGNVLLQSCSQYAQSALYLLEHESHPKVFHTLLNIMHLYFRSGVRLSLLVLRTLLAYCTSPG